MAVTGKWPLKAFDQDAYRCRSQYNHIFTTLNFGNTKRRWQSLKPGIIIYQWISSSHEDIYQIFGVLIWMFLYLLSGSRFVLWKKKNIMWFQNSPLSGKQNNWALIRPGKMPPLRNGLAFLLILVCVIQEQQSRAQGMRLMRRVNFTREGRDITKLS